ncbi:hypothetical protein FXO37_28538 [Capsicum annuum]|nr:hypothetical protein FXO37_28538 [Capsicum annuum]
MQMPDDFRQQWKILGLNYHHIAVVRFVLTYHGGKGQPVLACLSLLGSRFDEYKLVNLGMSEITLDIGTVFLTLFPNFHIPLADTYRMKALRIQVQIFGVQHDQHETLATLYY